MILFLSSPKTSEAKLILPKEDKGPSSFFYREAEVLFGALKTKSCLSVASSFCLAEKRAGVGKKCRRRIFFLLRFSFVRAKEK